MKEIDKRIVEERKFFDMAWGERIPAYEVKQRARELEQGSAALTVPARLADSISCKK